jgi:hypothetical protein
MVEKATEENRAASAGLPGITGRRRSLSDSPKPSPWKSSSRNGNENDFMLA